MSTKLSQINLGKLGANGVSRSLDVDPYDSVQLELIGQDTASFTARVRASFRPSAEVDFTAVSSVTNPWFYVAIKDYSLAGTVIAGATGTAFSADGVKAIALNCDRIQSIAVELSSYATGQLLVNIFPTTIGSNQ